MFYILKRPHESQIVVSLEGLEVVQVRNHGDLEQDGSSGDEWR